MFLGLTKVTSVGFFLDTVLTFKSKVFQDLHGFNLAWGLQIYNRFDDLGLVSRSHVCQ